MAPSSSRPRSRRCSQCRASAARRRSDGLAQFFAFGQYLGDRTSFAAISVLPAASILEFDLATGRLSGAVVRRRRAGTGSAGDAGGDARRGGGGVCGLRRAPDVGHSRARAVAFGRARCQDHSGCRARAHPAHDRQPRHPRQHRSSGRRAALGPGRPTASRTDAGRLVPRQVRGASAPDGASDRRPVPRSGDRAHDAAGRTATSGSRRCCGATPASCCTCGRPMRSRSTPRRSRLPDEPALEGWLWRHLSAYMVGAVEGPVVCRQTPAGRRCSNEPGRLCASVLAATTDASPPVQRVWQLFVGERLRRETSLSLQMFRSFAEVRVPYLDPATGVAAAGASTGAQARRHAAIAHPEAPQAGVSPRGQRKHRRADGAPAR